MSTNSIFISNFINIYVSPSEAFNTIKDRPNFIFPLLIVLLSSALMLLAYYSLVDFNWLNEHIISMSGTDLSTAEKNKMREGLSVITPVMQGSIAIVVSSLGLIIYSLLLSLYLFIISMITNDTNRYKNWFAVVCWSFMPMVFTMFAVGINIDMMPNNQFGPDQLNPLTFNNLFFKFDFDSGLKPLLDSLDLTLIWTIVLLIIGYQKLTSKSWLTSSVIVLLPYSLIFGIWFLIAV